MAPLVRVPPESDDGHVWKDSKAHFVDEARVPKQDDLLFDGCESDVPMRLMLEANLALRI